MSQDILNYASSYVEYKYNLIFKVGLFEFYVNLYSKPTLHIEKFVKIISMILNLCLDHMNTKTKQVFNIDIVLTDLKKMNRKICMRRLIQKISAVDLHLSMEKRMI